MIFAVGGVTSFLGADRRPAGSPASAIGTVMVGSLVLVALGEAMIPLAAAVDVLGIALLVGQQIVVDPAMTIYDINQVSLRQAIAPAGILGRVNASLQVADTGALLLGTIAAGFLGEAIGLRATLWLAVVICFLAAILLLLSPVSKVEHIPEMPAEVPT